MEHFVDWLAEVVVHKEVAGGLGGGSGKSKVVLCGHSMGGLLIGKARSHLVHLISFSKLNQQRMPSWR